MSAVAERPREETLDDSSGNSIRREGVRREVESIGTSRLEAGSYRSWPNKDDINLTTTTLQGGGP